MNSILLRDAIRPLLQQDIARRRERQIKIALVTRGKTLQHLADECGVSKALISMILNRKHAGYKHRPKIARALGLSVKQVFGDGGGSSTRRRGGRGEREQGGRV